MQLVFAVSIGQPVMGGPYSHCVYCASSDREKKARQCDVILFADQLCNVLGGASSHKPSSIIRPLNWAITICSTAAFTNITSHTLAS